ncbi:Helix-turn-helix domain-containing protein [bacterium A37T11]|nr:Helix-turn-helix domain-containing protein [bacterium A37T11]
MNISYKEYYHQKIISNVELTWQQARQYSKYPLKYAKAYLVTYKDGATLLRQQLNYKPFLMNLYEIRSETPFHLDFDIQGKNIFLFFLLNGLVDFMDQMGELIAKVTKNRLYASHYQDGKVNATCFQQNTIALVLTLDPAWVQKVFSPYPHLQSFIRHFLFGQLNYLIMPRCRINKRISNLLEEIYSLSNQNLGIVGGRIEACIAAIMEEYDALVDKKMQLPAYKAIAWLSENYGMPHLSNAFLENQFHTTEESLYAQFKSEFYCTPHEYVTYLRITKAQFLLNERNEPIADVYMQVGYEDGKKFQADYQKYLLKVTSGHLTSNNIHFYHPGCTLRKNDENR